MSNCLYKFLCFQYSILSANEMAKHVHLPVLVTVLLILTKGSKGDYQIGVGVADVTGPVAEVTFVSTSFL